MSNSNKNESIFAVSMLIYGLVMAGVLATIKDYVSTKYFFVLNCGLLYIFCAGAYMLFKGLNVRSFFSKMKRRKIRRSIYDIEDDSENYVDTETLFEDGLGITRVSTPRSPHESNFERDLNIKATDTPTLPKRRRYARHVSLEGATDLVKYEEPKSSEKIEDKQIVTSDMSEPCNEIHEKVGNSCIVVNTSNKKMLEKTMNKNQVTYRCRRKPHKEEVTDLIAIPATCESTSEKAEEKQFGIAVHCDNFQSRGEESNGNSRKRNEIRKKSSNAILKASGEVDRCGVKGNKRITPIPIKFVVSSDFLNGAELTICFNAA